MKKIKYGRKVLHIHKISPFDFMTKTFWPFSYYVLIEDKLKKDKSFEIKREWKLKPKEMDSDEKKINDAVVYAFELSAGINKAEHDTLKNDNKVFYNYILGEIYAQAYDLDSAQKLINPQIEISREFAEALAIKCKFLNIEPYSLIANINQEKPELYNPKRYDFNWIILSTGWDKERREQEKLNAKMKSMTATRRR